MQLNADDPAYKVLYHFNYGSGSTAFNLADASKNGVITEAVWTQSELGQALDFDGDDDHVNIASLSIYPLYTFIMWIPGSLWKGLR